MYNPNQIWYQKIGAHVLMTGSSFPVENVFINHFKTTAHGKK